MERNNARGGRPPISRAGDVDARILDAATRLFLERGFDATSCDQVALAARAGKASIYARYENKAALFAAVIERKLARPARAEEVAADRPLRRRLALTGMEILEDALQDDAVALVRLIIAEVPRLPPTLSVAQGVHRQAYLQRVAGAITLGAPANARATDEAMPVATRFVDLVLMPALMQALLGVPAEVLLAEATKQIDEVIEWLVSSGRLADWV